jgi:hypothetical protein
MKRAALAALLLCGSPANAATDSLHALYAKGAYDAAMQAGAAAGSAEGYAVAARAALADAALRPAPCLDCLKRAENFARRAIAADPGLADGHVWLAAALGYESRLTGLIRAKLRGAPGEAKAALDAALKDDPANPYALAAMGGWNMEIVHVGGAYLADHLYGASEAAGIALFDRAVQAAPHNVAVHYQIALSLAGFDPAGYRARVIRELDAAIAAPAASAYERDMQGRAAELAALLRRGDGQSDGRNDSGDDDKFAALLHRYQGYP